MFHTLYANRPVPHLEKCDSPSIVETAGYLSAEQQILTLLDAGRRLDIYRKEHFDGNTVSEVEKLTPDPTRSPGFDLADATRIQQNLTAKKAALKGKPSQVPKVKPGPLESTPPTVPVTAPPSSGKPVVGP